MNPSGDNENQDGADKGGNNNWPKLCRNDVEIEH